MPEKRLAKKYQHSYLLFLHNNHIFQYRGNLHILIHIRKGDMNIHKNQPRFISPAVMIIHMSFNLEWKVCNGTQETQNAVCLNGALESIDYLNILSDYTVQSRWFSTLFSIPIENDKSFLSYITHLTQDKTAKIK